MQEPSNGTCVDFVRLYVADIDHPITEELCGVQSIPEIRTIDQHIILHIHTDNAIMKRGFELYYSRVEDYEVRAFSSITILIVCVCVCVWVGVCV